MAPSDPANPNSPLEPKDWSYLQQFMPSIRENGYFSKTRGIEFTYHSLDLILDSSQFNTEHWITMAGIIRNNYDDYDGFIIIHGTDTMAYTASALSFMLLGLSKPIVLTGSQLPIFHPRTDAVTNLGNAIHIAGHKAFDMPVLPEVSICFEDRVYRGNRTIKFSTNDFKGFASPNYPPLVELEESIRFFPQLYNRPAESDLQIMNSLDTRVISISLFPGMRAESISRLVGDDTKGLIIHTFGAGNVPCTPEFIRAIEEVRNNGITVMFITQCYNGSVELGKYKSSQVFRELGVVSGGDMTNEAALAKMMWVLGNFRGDEISKKLLENVVGERS